MALPLTRDFDAVDSGPLPANTVNNLQDAIVGFKHGLITLPINLASLAKDASIVSGEGTNRFGILIPANATNTDVNIQFPIPQGSRIQSWRASFTDKAPPTNGDTLEFFLQENNYITDTITAIGVIQPGDFSGTLQTVSESAISHIVAADTFVQLKCSPSSSGDLAGGLLAIRGIDITYDRP